MVTGLVPKTSNSQISVCPLPTSKPRQDVVVSVFVQCGIPFSGDVHCKTQPWVCCASGDSIPHMAARSWLTCTHTNNARTQTMHTHKQCTRAHTHTHTCPVLSCCHIAHRVTWSSILEEANYSCCCYVSRFYALLAHQHWATSYMSHIGGHFAILALVCFAHKGTCVSWDRPAG